MTTGRGGTRGGWYGRWRRPYSGPYHCTNLLTCIVDVSITVRCFWYYCDSRLILNGIDPGYILSYHGWYIMEILSYELLWWCRFGDTGCGVGAGGLDVEQYIPTSSLTHTSHFGCIDNLKCEGVWRCWVVVVVIRCIIRPIHTMLMIGGL